MVLLIYIYTHILKGFLAQTTVQKSSRKTTKQLPKPIAEPANQKNLIQTHSRSTHIADHVSGRSSSAGTDLLGPRAPLAEHPSAPAAERRDTGQYVTAPFSSGRSGTVVRLRVLEQRCKLLQQTEAPRMSSAMAGGTQIWCLMAPRGNIAAKGWVEGPSLLRTFVIPAPQPGTEASCERNADLEVNPVQHHPPRSCCGCPSAGQGRAWTPKLSCQSTARSNNTAFSKSRK